MDRKMPVLQSPSPSNLKNVGHQPNKRGGNSGGNSNNSSSNSSRNKLRGKKSVTFQPMVEVYQLNEAWQVRVKTTALKTEEQQQAERRFIQRNC